MRRSTLGMWLLLGVAAGGFFVAAAGQAQTSPVPESIAKERIAKGRIVYTRYCVSCHGRDARGDGPLAADLRVPVPDLRTLAARSGGVYPHDRVVRIISNGNDPIPSSSLMDLPAVRSVRMEDGVYSLAVTEPHIALPALLDRLRQTNRELSNLTTRHASLEDVFVTLTGRHLREDSATT